MFANLGNPVRIIPESSGNLVRDAMAVEVRSTSDSFDSDSLLRDGHLKKSDFPNNRVMLERVQLNRYGETVLGIVVNLDTVCVLVAERVRETT